ncbi:MAG: 5-oxoprolinase subunit PxpB [Flavobacteriaceae bacterium]
MSYPITIKPFGAQAVIIEWPDKVEEAILEDILQFDKYLQSKYTDEEQWENIPAYNSLTLIKREGDINFGKFKRTLKEWYSEKRQQAPVTRYQWKLPVCYDQEFAPDLKEVAKLLNKSEREIIDLHTGSIYTVFGIGFLPGFMYLGGLPETLITARKDSPRLKVAKGSVGLAGQQTGIYPQDSPGGWNIIGKCPIPIFNLNHDDPCFVNVGDKIAFYEISRGAYDLHKIEAEVGIFKLEKKELNA